MSLKSQLIQELTDSETKKETSQKQIDTSHPFNMKIFWKKIDEYDLSNNNKLNPYKTNHLISLFSQHGKYYK